MNREDIIRMAREAAKGHPDYEDNILDPGPDEYAFIERFFQAAYAAGQEDEREACAKVCENMERNGAWITKEEAAAAIRARGNA